MIFTPETHLKAARMVLEAAEAASGAKKCRLESLARLHQLRAKQLEAKMTSTTIDEPNEIATANVPFMTHWIREPPGVFSVLEAWEQYLTELLSLPDSIVTRAAIKSAEEKIAAKRAEET
ncbi:hypothetical protein [Bradyrhizobium australiense]|uniref:Uncharacterized protein n=1 Tax=Bradyrhizobium australiense TaxID=2721161 RepID=A0A7Y4GWI0_9BRAD|nr:hypothetical protein [Bradyrhizobium australiense]NOJ43039.1 hypothetical protein [Bradyrhizobium australiense]